MPAYRVQMGFPVDSALPRDVITLNPHFYGSDPEQLAGALATNLAAWAHTSTSQFHIKVYDATKAPPSYPLASRDQPGLQPATSAPREIALCLSYYGTYNRPRYRGRLFLPIHWITTAPGLRPTAAQQNIALDFATSVLTKALPAQTDWVVWSSVEKKSQGQVTNIWCDDEWDTMRSRGLKATARTLQTIG